MLQLRRRERAFQDGIVVDPSQQTKMLMYQRRARNVGRWTGLTARKVR